MPIPAGLDAENAQLWEKRDKTTYGPGKRRTANEHQAVSGLPIDLEIR